MFTTRRYSAGILALGAVLGSLALAPAASAAPPNDSVMVNNTDPARGDISVFPQGSALIGPAVVEIDTLIADVGDLTVILDTVALLAQITAPFGVTG